MDRKTAVVTGATGMLALALMRKLSAENYLIYAVIRPNSARRGNIPATENIRIIECDLHEINKLPSLIHEKCDEFYHFSWDGPFGSARNDMTLQIKDIQASVNAAQAACELGCKVFLGAGSQAEYGRAEFKLSPETPAFPETGYGIAKLCAGQMTRALCRRNGIKHVWCRIFSTYGPYDSEKTMVMSGIIKMTNGERPQYTKGEQLWDYLYCDDAANAFYLAAQKGIDGSVYCIGSGQPRKLCEYIYAIRDAVDRNIDIGIGEIPYYEYQVMYLCADISSLQKDTGFKPEYTFEKGIAETVAWYKSKNHRGS